jgi:hypothetical protein
MVNGEQAAGQPLRTGSHRFPDERVSLSLAVNPGLRRLCDERCMGSACDLALRVAVALCVVLTGVVVHAPVAAAATADPTLTGEDFFGVGTFQTLAGSTCNADDGTGLINFSASGNATGPYPGKYTETGTVTLGARPPASPSVNPLNVITSIETTFSIASSDGSVTVTGTTERGDVPQSTPLGSFDFMNQGECNQVFGRGTNSFIAGVCYTATLPTGTDVGYGAVAGAQSRVISPSNFHNDDFQSNEGQGPLHCPGQSATDTTPAIASIATPQDGASYSLNQVANADYTCDDPSGVQQCSGTVPNGSPIDTSTAGRHVFDVNSLDSPGNAGTRSVSYTVLAGDASGDLDSGGTVTTDPGNVGATAAVPIQTSVTAPLQVSGTLSITTQVTATVAPTGFSLFGKEVVLTGPSASTTSPYEVSFTVDSSFLTDNSTIPPTSTAPADVQVFRDGVALTGCTGPTAAAPDPCIVSRGSAPGGGGDALVTVRTSHFSTWSLGRLALKYSLAGPFAPVAAAPAVNLAKAGSIIPVRFALGGNQGLDVLAAGYPKSTITSCTKGRTHEIEQTADSANPPLKYDPVSKRYTYRWKTTQAMKGCRDLVLKFRDLSEMRMLFKLR